MIKYLKIGVFLLLIALESHAQGPVDYVNVILGSSGDHGQMSPSASYPFSMISLGPQTYPNAHMGYDNKARIFNDLETKLYLIVLGETKIYGYQN